jgi:hypothetical protein
MRHWDNRWSNNDYGANYINRSIETKIRNTGKLATIRNI